MTLRHFAGGFTLLELLLVMAMIGVLVTVAAWGSQDALRALRLNSAGHQLLEDLKTTQARAENSGSMTMRHGTLVSQRVYLVFEPDTYSVYQWCDDNNNGVPEATESRRLLKKSLPEGVAYGWGQNVTRRACSNANSSPGSAVSFNRPNYSPCNGQPCIKFDHNGFSVMGPGAIYLSNGQHSLALTATRTGHFTMCEWNGERWR